MIDFLVLVFFWGGIWGIVGALIADRKGWTPGGAFGLCLLFGIFGLGYLATRPDIPTGMRESSGVPAWNPGRPGGVANERRVVSTPLDPFFVRTYTGDTPDMTGKEFVEDAAVVASTGYFPESQQWHGVDLTVVYRLRNDTAALGPARPTGPQDTASFGYLNLAAVTLVIAGAMVAVSAILPWIAISNGFTTLSRNGLDGGGDGTIIVILGIGIALCGLGLVFDESRPLAIPALGLAVVTLVVLLLDYNNITTRIASTPEFAQFGSVGVGMYLGFIGGGLAVGAAVIAYRREAPEAAAVAPSGADPLGLPSAPRKPNIPVEDAPTRWGER